MMPRVASALLCCGVALAMLAPTPSRAQDDTRQDIAMQNQILELRHDLDTLRDQVAAGGTAAPAPAPQSYGNGGGSSASGTTATDVLPMLLDRVSQLEDQVRTLQGTADELRNGLEKQNADLTKQIADLAFRVQTLEGGQPSATAPGGTPPVPTGTLTPSPPYPGPALRNPGVTPPSPAPAHATLQQGYAALARRDYPTAEAAARDTLAVPHAPRAYDAQFLLAQSLAGQRNYQQAALAYDDTYDRERKGTHAPDALLGLASSLASLGEKPAACATLDKLRAEFPGGRPDIRASAGAVAKRAACH